MTSSDKWPLRISVYGAGEAINGAGALDQQILAQLYNLGRVATNRFVAATAQLDSSSVPSVRFVLDPLNRQSPIQLPDVDVGDPQELVNFAEWSGEICPAKQSVVVLSGHGAAWEDEIARQVVGTRGISMPAGAKSVPAGAWHHARSLFGPKITPEGSVARALLIDGSDHDFLSNAKLGAVCDRMATMQGGVIDLLVFDACLMSSWEILTEITPAVSTVVASVDELSAAGIDLSGPVMVATQNQGQMAAKELAGTFAELFQPKASFDTCVAIDLSISQWAAAISSFGAFCDNVLPWIEASPTNASKMRDALGGAATSIVRFWNGGLADVSALAQAVTAISGLPNACQQALRNAESALSACVIGKSLGSDYSNAMGLSVFAPNSLTNFTTNRPDYSRLRFSSTTGWIGVLDALFPV